VEAEMDDTEEATPQVLAVPAPMGSNEPAPVGSEAHRMATDADHRQNSGRGRYTGTMIGEEAASSADPLMQYIAVYNKKCLQPGASFISEGRREDGPYTFYTSPDATFGASTGLYPSHPTLGVYSGATLNGKTVLGGQKINFYATPSTSTAASGFIVGVHAQELSPLPVVKCLVKLEAGNTGAAQDRIQVFSWDEMHNPSSRCHLASLKSPFSVKIGRHVNAMSDAMAEYLHALRSGTEAAANDNSSREASPRIAALAAARGRTPDSPSPSQRPECETPCMCKTCTKDRQYQYSKGQGQRRVEVCRENKAIKTAAEYDKELNKHKKELEDCIAEHKKELKECKEELEDCIAEHKKELEDCIAEHKKELKECKEELSKSETARGVWEAGCHKHMGAATTAGAELAIARTEIDAFKQQLKEQVDSNTDLRSSLSTASNNLRSMKRKYEELSETSAKAENDHDLLRGFIAHSTMAKAGFAEYVGNMEQKRKKKKPSRRK
jgi:hypothetical protein